MACAPYRAAIKSFGITYRNILSERLNVCVQLMRRTAAMSTTSALSRQRVLVMLLLLLVIMLHVGCATTSSHRRDRRVESGAGTVSTYLLVIIGHTSCKVSNASCQNPALQQRAVNINRLEHAAGNTRVHQTGRYCGLGSRQKARTMYRLQRGLQLIVRV